ncbi:hypothetical protein V7S43_011122 [Phytophthora oleae]|uniref:Crinkler effector protein N-terminal domain-containing protein n=1 Tax=Phytophthora oleae TaxID=2107226 RepID=A0ABD3FA34_9STRA
MKSLQCVAITDGRVFVVDIDDCKNVWLLINMIKEQKMYHFPGHHLKLYVAKKDAEWLKPDDPDVQRLENGESSRGITALMNDSSTMLLLNIDYNRKSKEENILLRRRQSPIHGVCSLQYVYHWGVLHD